MGEESDTGGHWGHQCTVGEHRCPGGGPVTYCAANIITHCDIPRTAANLVSSAPVCLLLATETEQYFICQKKTISLLPVSQFYV